MLSEQQAQKLRDRCFEASKNGRRQFRKKNKSDDKGETPAAMAEAKRIVDGIPSLIETRMADGHHHAVVTGVPAEDWRTLADLLGSYEYKPLYLRGVSRLVFQACSSLRLRPALQFWTDAERGSGHNIVIYW